MTSGHHQWEKAWLRLVGFAKHLPGDLKIHENRVHEYHEIVSTLEQLCQHRLAEFRVPNSEFGQKPVALSFATRRRQASVTMSDARYCGRDILLARVEGLVQFLEGLANQGELTIGEEVTVAGATSLRPPSHTIEDPRRVAVAHGRNEGARKAMFAFLRAIDLAPIEWEEAVGKTQSASPYIGEVLDALFNCAQAVIVLLTGDDLARLGTRYQKPEDGSYEKDLTPQARPNVLFEAGMAFGRHANRTVLVRLGQTRPFSDVAGRHSVSLSNKVEDRLALANRLTNLGCAVKTEGRTDWQIAGDFDCTLQHPDIGATKIDSSSKRGNSDSVKNHSQNRSSNRA